MKTVGSAWAWPAKSASSFAASSGCICPWPMAKASSSPATPPCWPAWKRPVSWPCVRAAALDWRAGDSVPTQPDSPSALPRQPQRLDGRRGRRLRHNRPGIGTDAAPERHLDPTHHPRWTRGEAGPWATACKCLPTRCGISRSTEFIPLQVHERKTMETPLPFTNTRRP